MGNLARFWIFFLVCVLFAAIASPWLYLGVQELSGHISWGWLNYLSKHPFHRYFNRVLQAGILLGITSLLRRSGFLSLQALGLMDRRFLSRFVMGFGSSVMVMGMYVGVLYWMGIQQWRFQIFPDDWMMTFMKVMMVALGVGVAEEIFFRGFFYRLCSREVGHRLALGMNILFFSVIHYVKPQQASDLKSVTWSSGFKLFSLAFQRFGNPTEMIGGLLVLMLIAWMLCWALNRSKSLYFSMGLHAGWIVVLQLSSEWMIHSGSRPTWFLGGGDLSQGVMTLIPLSLQFVLLMVCLRFRGNEGASVR